MENASKALIMAGSILLAVLIVAMGVMIFNKAQNTADSTNLDTAEINMFNQKFERYANNQLGSQVKSLISLAISNASTNQDDPAKLPTIQLQNQPSANLSQAVGGQTASQAIQDYVDLLTPIRNKVISTHTYKITCEYSTTGLIDKITIDYNT